MGTGVIHRNFIQRLLGICATRAPSDNGCWMYQDNDVIVDLGRLPELEETNRAVRLENKAVPDRILLIRGNDGRYYAFKNRCTHGGRRLDLVPGTQQVQCCSIGKSTYDYSGKVLSGPAKGPLTPYPVQVKDDQLVIHCTP